MDNMTFFAATTDHGCPHAWFTQAAVRACSPKFQNPGFAPGRVQFQTPVHRQRMAVVPSKTPIASVGGMDLTGLFPTSILQYLPILAVQLAPLPMTSRSQNNRRGLSSAILKINSIPLLPWHSHQSARFRFGLDCATQGGRPLSTAQTDTIAAADSHGSRSRRPRRRS
jgi:hypothetical protein